MNYLSVQPERLARLASLYRSEFGPAPYRIFSSPGRAEIVGNHTDHNRGKVLVSAISCDVLCLAAPRQDGIVEIRAESFAPIRLSLSDLESREREKGKAVSLARGVAAALTRQGIPLGGFNAVTHSTVFRGAGVSSSAAFEVLIAEVFNALWCGGALAPITLALAAQYAENVYFGKPCGLLDQCGVAFGGLNKIDFFTPERPLIEAVPPPEGYRIVLTNTGGSHSGLTSHYADIRREMGEVAAALGASELRDVSREMLFEQLPRLRRRVSDRAILRAVHYFEENDRVDAAAEGMKRGDTAAFLAAVRKSGESSLGFLQNCYVPGEIAQPIVLALAMSGQYLKKGAFRMMGGGFTGTVLAFCAEEEEEEYVLRMARVFGRENVFRTSLRAEGAAEVQM